MSYDLSQFFGGGFESTIENIPMILSMVTYVLTALSLYTIAQNRCIPHPWLAWVPAVNIWLLGSVSDQYQYVGRGQVKSRRKLLLTLNIVLALSAAVLACMFLSGFFSAIKQAILGAGEDALLESLLDHLFYTGGGFLLMVPVWIVKKVFEFMALYDVYRSSEPQNAQMYLVMSILIPVTGAFFLFICRNKEQGMPPRQQICREAPGKSPEQTAAAEKPAAQEESENPEVL